MSMVTSCPSCATTFRVSTEQLKARQGKVRCGQCLAVFDGFKALASIPDVPQAAPASPSAPPAVASPMTETLPLLDFEPPPPPEAEPKTVEIVPPPGARSAAAGVSTRAAGAPLDEGPVREPAVSPPAAYSAAPAPRPLPGAGPFAADAPAKPRRRWPLVLVASLLLVAMGVQGLYFYRTEIATSVPALRPVIDALCALAGCQLAPPRRTDALAIESSDLQADPARASVIVLTATLRNRSAGTVAYPALELTLTNQQDQTVARRVIQPADYLVRGTAVESGMSPRAEVAIRLEIDTGDLRPAGYRLYLFYP